MKPFYLFPILLLAVSCNDKSIKQHHHSEIKLPTSSVEKISLTTLTFDQLDIHFGPISDTSVAIGEFKFTNTGTHPAKLRKVMPLCKCTVPQYERGEIAPGATSTISVKFKPNMVEEGEQNYQNSSVKILGNFNDTIELKISAFVNHHDSGIK